MCSDVILLRKFTEVRHGGRRSIGVFQCRDCRGEFETRTDRAKVMTGLCITCANKRGRTEDSHILVKFGNHPAAKKGFVPEHRLVMESMLGRYLSPEERVHHINCIKSDNRPENLALCKDDREHFLAHGSLNKCVEALIEAGALLFDREQMQYRVNAESLKGQAVADAILIARHGAHCA